MRCLLTAAVLGLAACAPPAPPPSTPPPEVAPGTSAVRPTAAQLDPYVGRYTNGASTLTIRRAGDTLVAERPGQPPLALALVGLGTFADTTGAAWLFDLSPPGARLSIVAANGARSMWSR